MAVPLSKRYGTAHVTGNLMLETAGTGLTVIDFRAADFQTGFNDSMQRNDEPRTGAAWARIQQMHGATMPAHAADDLVRALRRGCFAAVRSGGTFHARIAPSHERFAPRSWHLTMTRSCYRVH
ncbi:MAG TPA: hypothetical protein VMM36_12965 [Opitutaceae bacterium]|nr:hypothetical protein [Opitutaceae bacterium]